MSANNNNDPKKNCIKGMDSVEFREKYGCESGKSLGFCYKNNARTCHPDKGGKNFQAMNDDYQICKAKGIDVEKADMECDLSKLPNFSNSNTRSRPQNDTTRPSAEKHYIDLQAVCNNTTLVIYLLLIAVATSMIRQLIYNVAAKNHDKSGGDLMDEFMKGGEMNLKLSMIKIKKFKVWLNLIMSPHYLWSLHCEAIMNANDPDDFFNRVTNIVEMHCKEFYEISYDTKKTNVENTYLDMLMKKLDDTEVLKGGRKNNKDKKKKGGGPLFNKKLLFDVSDEIKKAYDKATTDEEKKAVIEEMSKKYKEAYDKATTDEKKKEEIEEKKKDIINKKKKKVSTSEMGNAIIAYLQK